MKISGVSAVPSLIGLEQDGIHKEKQVGLEQDGIHSKGIALEQDGIHKAGPAATVTLSAAARALMG